MGTRDRWVLLMIFTGFSAILLLVTVLIAQLETYVPGRKRRALPPEAEDESQQHQDEPTAA